MAFGQGVGSVVFEVSVGEGTVLFCSSVGTGISSVVALATIVGVTVGWEVGAFVDGAAVVVAGREVVVRTVGDVVDREVCVAAFERGVEVIPAEMMPATVGRIDCVTTGEEEALTTGDAPNVAAGAAA